MRVSWKFFVALVAGFFLVFGATVGAFYLNLGVPSDLSTWISEINQKKRMLAAQAGSPKLLLVGGSGTLFGISAQEIQSQTGYPTINLGSHAALGTSYILHEAERSARPGDTVLLVLEYQLYDSGKIERVGTDNLEIDYIVSEDPGFFHTLSATEQWNVFMLTSGHRLLQGLENRLRRHVPRDTGLYNVRYLNNWGDLTNHAEVDRRREQQAHVVEAGAGWNFRLPEHPKGFASIKTFCRRAQAQHIDVLATYPNLSDRPSYHLPPARQTVRKIHDFFVGLEVSVLGDYTDSLLSPDQFFDTPYHLTEEASIARTRRLIPLLSPYLKKKSAR